MHVPTLRGLHVTLDPLATADAEALHAAIPPDDDVWTWFAGGPRTRDDMRRWIEGRLAPGPSRAHAYVQRDPAGHAMGSTSLFDIDLALASAEIGHTWLAKPYRGTNVNAEAKRLLLAHAFETLALARVQIVTDARNLRSRAAIRKLGATEEGILRNFRRGPDGRPRDSAVHSITDREWPAICDALDARIAASVQARP